MNNVQLEAKIIFLKTFTLTQNSDILDLISTKFVHDRYVENYKTLIQEDLNKWKNILCSWIWNPNIVKMSVISKLIHRFNTIPIKILAGFFCTYRQMVSKIHKKRQRNGIAKAVLKKNKEVGGITLPGFEKYLSGHFYSVLQFGFDIFSWLD